MHLLFPGTDYRIWNKPTHLNHYDLIIYNHCNFGPYRGLILYIYITFVFLHWLSTTMYPKSRRKKSHLKKKQNQKATHLFFTVHGGNLCLNVLFVPQRCRFSMGDLGRIFFLIKRGKNTPRKNNKREPKRKKKKHTKPNPSNWSCKCNQIVRIRQFIATKREDKLVQLKWQGFAVDPGGGISSFIPSSSAPNTTIFFFSPCFVLGRFI